MALVHFVCATLCVHAVYGWVTGCAGEGILRETQLPDGYPYGFAPLQSESLAGSMGDEAPPDVKETYSIGPLIRPPHVADVR